MAACAGGQFVYAPLPNPVTLQSHGAYYLVSREFSGGDQWLDQGPISTMAAAVANNSIYSYDGASWIPANTVNTSYVPPNFQYSISPPGLPDLTVLKTHYGSFMQGDASDTYTITVSNAGGTETNAAASVTDTIPSGLIPMGITGSGWNCTQPAGPCTRSDALAAGSTYPPITITVNVANTAPAAVLNTATVSGGGEANTGNDTANDLTTILPSGTAFVTKSTLPTSLRNDFSGWVGMQLALPGNPLTVVAVGRTCVAGNGASHVVKFVMASTGSDVPGGAATVSLAGCLAGQFVYSALTNPITLQANVSYYLVSQEFRALSRNSARGAIGGTSGECAVRLHSGVGD